MSFQLWKSTFQAGYAQIQSLRVFILNEIKMDIFLIHIPGLTVTSLFIYYQNMGHLFIVF